MKEYISSNRTIPTVNFDSKDLELYMYNFMVENMNRTMNVNEYLGLVMLRLGFKTEDKIKLRNFDRENKEGTFQCRVNGCNGYNIKFINVGNVKKHTQIILTYFNSEVTYECFPLRLSELGVRIIPVREKVMYEDGVAYTRELNRERTKIIVNYDKYKLEIAVTKPKNLELSMYDSNGEYSRYRLNNEEKVFEYLNNFLPILAKGDIVSVYKKIREISLGDDISIYPEISLKFSYEDKITDLIHLKNGELERFGVTLLKLGRTLFLNKDGSFTYEINDIDNLFNIIMTVNNDGKTNYNIEINEDSNTDMIGELIKEDTDTIKKNVVNIRKLVKDNFKNR